MPRVAFEPLKSLTCSQQFNAEIEFDWKDISKRYDEETNKFRGIFRVSNAGFGYIAGMIIYPDKDNENRNFFIFWINGAKNGSASFDLKITDTNKTTFVIGGKDHPPINANILDRDGQPVYQFMSESIKGRVETISGTIKTKFEMVAEIERYQTLANLMAMQLVKDVVKPNDFKLKIVTEDDSNSKDEEHHVMFNKDFLSKISEVFRRMIENPNTVESKIGAIKMPDVSLATLEAFKRIFDVGNVKEEDLNVDLLMFAHKYDVLGLVDLCSDYIGNNLKKDTILEVIKAAYFIEDSRLFKKAVAFLMTNLGKIEETPEWKELKKCHPDCFMKITEIMLFEHKFSETLKFQ